MFQVQSALDYGKLGNHPLDHNIEFENINTKLGRVKPDVIIGYPGVGTKVNRDHVLDNRGPFRNDGIYNLTLTPGPRNQFTYYSCINYNDKVERGLINLEIGDEELYLENTELTWTAMYQTEFDIHVNERNPRYEYPTNRSIFTLPGAYSKDNSYNISSTGHATFIVDEFNSPTRIGLNYSGPYSGTYNKYNQSLNVCCIDYIGSRLKHHSKESFEPEAREFLKLYPNPNDGRQLVVNFQFNDSGNTNIQIINSLGEIVLEKDLKAIDPSLETTTSISLNRSLNNGMYVVRLYKDSDVLTSRLIISK